MGRVLMHYDWYPYKTRLGTQNAQREDHVKYRSWLSASQGEASEATNCADILILASQPPDNEYMSVT